MYIVICIDIKKKILILYDMSTFLDNYLKRKIDREQRGQIQMQCIVFCSRKIE